MNHKRLRSLCGWFAICAVVFVVILFLILHVFVGDRYKDYWAPPLWLASSPMDIRVIRLEPLYCDNSGYQTINQPVTIACSNICTKMSEEMRGQHEWQKFLPTTAHWVSSRQLYIKFETISGDVYGFVLQIHNRFPVVHYSGITHTESLRGINRRGGMKASRHLYDLLDSSLDDVRWVPARREPSCIGNGTAARASGASNKGGCQ